ncbi:MULTISPECIES: Spy/CpxP family protein refolding chaperone [Bacteria]|jgi:hypothetical protein|uniref:Spy/CpxP family protein refolding chaperone n=1 Tax=Bacteria TaxID=2 RepID=UPI00035FDACB|nr:Spy/CpxP family protein refolding chaperone [Hyphomicrobium zavarzinii]MCV0377475.1 Spy/CpxP family protein refolding chaperone [Microbacterium sp.]MDX2259347.1 Spy/CpxP family protein refolding chaperone [Hyphomicrobiaceae bacterium]ODT26873.1 MAG: hypothetical protein ABS54_06700 [Hyphomicrobium sp. SCN 65-11]HRO80789.1 Spy/CpxP family protein refolding chaperone [Alicycliphilus denitrificans]HRP67221.1 Spy/CpxP family protein refolding chaperone [Thauera sp.]
MRNTRKSLLASILVSATLLAGAISVQAQQMQHGPGMMGPGMMGPGMPMGGGMMGCPMMGGQGMTMGQMPMGGMGPGMMMTGPAIEGRLAYLKAELGITEAQTAAWNGYVTAVKARQSAMQGTHQGMMQAWQSGTAVARLDAHTKAMESMVEALKALRPATDALYAVLTPDQKTKADQLLGMGCCMM